jgi:hypothetical protein
VVTRAVHHAPRQHCRRTTTPIRYAPVG